MFSRSDGEIQAAVFDELAWLRGVTAAAIGVSVHRHLVLGDGGKRGFAHGHYSTARRKRTCHSSGPACVVTWVKPWRPSMV